MTLLLPKKGDLSEYIKQLKSELKIVAKDAIYVLELQTEKKIMKISRSTQNPAPKKILDYFNFTAFNPVTSPMLLDSLLSRKALEKERDFALSQVVETLIMMLGSLPDFAFSISFLSRSLENPIAEKVSK